MADGRTGKGYPKAQHSNSSPLNNIAGHQHGRDTGASTRNWHGCGLPTRVVGVSARCPHRRALLTPARVISPSRCQQPPHDVNAPLTVPTTRVHTRGSTRARAERAADTADNAHCPGEHPHQGQTPGGLLRIAHHPLGVRTQGPRFKKHAPHTRAESSPCVRPSVAQSPPLCAAPADTDTEKGRSEGADPPTGEANQQTGQPPEEGTANRMGPARTTWEVAPAPPGEPRRLCPGPAPAPLRRNPLGPSSGCGRCRQPLLDPGEPAELGGGRGQGGLDGLARQTRQLAVGQPEGVARLGVLLHQAGGGWRQPGRFPVAEAFYCGFGVVAALTAPPSASSAAPTRKGAAVEKRAMRNPHAA